MKASLRKEISSLINKLKLNCTIDDFKNKVGCYNISSSQKLSENFIEKFENKVNWNNISYYQKLSENFIEKFENKVNITVQKANHTEKSLKQKTKEIKEYAKKHNLKFDGKFLYAFRNHDFNGCGQFNKTIYYESGKYYKDWHCDMNENAERSFGLGIFPHGNTKIKVRQKSR